MEFLGMGWLEIGIIILVALIVVGPDRLPEYGRKAGRFIRQFRKITSGVTGEISKAINFDEEDEAGSSLNKDLEDIQKSLEKDAEELKKSLREEAASLQKTMEQGAKEASETLAKEAQAVTEAVSASAQEAKKEIEAGAETAAQNLVVEDLKKDEVPPPPPPAQSEDYPTGG
jgi:sec-independent protein translocase protein TatB